MADASELGELGPEELATLLGLPPHLVPAAPIHSSATGAVWSGRDRRVGRNVVIKVLAAEHSDRLVAEVRALGRLDEHPYVLSASVVGHGVDGTAWVVTEEMPATLAAASQTSSRAEVLTWAGHLAEALEDVHRNGVVHGDITPTNVLIDAAGRARLADFGAARLECDSDSPTPTGHTPRYAAPERRRGVPATRASDIYGYGATVAAAMPRGINSAPLRARRLLRRCVRADPAKRPNAAAVARIMARQ